MNSSSDLTSTVGLATMQFSKTARVKRAQRISAKRKRLSPEEHAFTVLWDMAQQGLCPPLICSSEEINAAIEQSTPENPYFAEGLTELDECLAALQRGHPVSGEVTCYQPNYSFRPKGEAERLMELPRTILKSWGSMAVCHYLPPHLMVFISPEIINLEQTLEALVKLRQWCYLAWYPRASPEAIEQSKKLGLLGLHYGFTRLEFCSLFSPYLPVGRLRSLRYDTKTGGLGYEIE